MPTPLNRREALAGMLTSSAAVLAASLSDLTQLLAEESFPKNSPTRPQITISKETTFITEPLGPDGLPDYVAALNQHCSRGVTPENNAAVPFWQAMGPSRIEPEHRENYFKMLGIAPLPEKGNYFRTSDDQLKLHEPKDNRSVSEDDSQPVSLYQQMTQAARRPWSRQEFPVWAEWLSVNQRPLALLAEASRRPRRFDPWFRTKRGQDVFFSLSAIELSRDAARAFVLCAMLRMHDGKTNEAWRDLFACHRLARLIGQGPTVIEGLVAITLDTFANATDRALIEHAKLPAEKIIAMRQQLAALPPPCNFANSYGLGDRFCILSSTLTIMLAKSLDEQNRLLAEAASGRVAANQLAIVKPILNEMGDEDIDWDTVLRLSNTWCDRWTNALRISDPVKQQKALGDIEKELAGIRESLESQKPLRQFPPAERSKVAAERVAHACIAILFRPVNLHIVTNRIATESNLTQLAFALAAYRADHDAYPEKLTELSPKYIERIPKDVFSNGEMHYSRHDRGYLLYSVGQNGRDDGGKAMSDCRGDEGWDDLIVRVPSTKP
jgi:hypothetical protein